MNRFDETVEKLASSPWKQALLKEAALPRLLVPPKTLGTPHGPIRPELAEALTAAAQKKRAVPKRMSLPELQAKTSAWYDPAVNKAKNVGQTIGDYGRAVGGGAAGYVRDQAGRDMTKNLLGAATAGGAAYLGGRLMSGDGLAEARNDAEHKELGKLDAQSKHRQAQLKRLSPLHQAMLGQVSSDEILGKADPKLLQSSYDTMRRFAPTLATDPNATRAFLQEVATYGKPPSYATLKLLADTEGSVMKTYGGHGDD